MSVTNSFENDYTSPYIVEQPVKTQSKSSQRKSQQRNTPLLLSSKRGSASSQPMSIKSKQVQSIAESSVISKFDSIEIRNQLEEEEQNQERKIKQLI